MFHDFCHGSAMTSELAIALAAPKIGKGGECGMIWKRRKMG
jgi:hypothetical protein